LKRRDPMIRRNCHSLLWFGAVAAALLLALPALADEIEPEPYVEEEAVEPEPEPVVEAAVEKEVESNVAKQRDRNFDQLFDLIILRPLGLGATLVGGALFLPAALIASPGGAEGIQGVWEAFVAPSFESTFQNPLGEF
jgi:hypothetical protein